MTNRMNYQELLQLLQATPFEAFRIHLSDGKTFDLVHRDFIWLTPTRLLLAVPSKESERLVIETHIVSLLHIVRIEILTRAAA